MAFSKQQTLSIYGVFYLPLSVLTGITFSVFLPAALSVLVPAMNSDLFISLPQLWHAFLSWVTRPCLFVLLNGIIVVLTATSGAFSNVKSDSGSDFYANLLGKMEKANSGGLMADPAACDAHTRKSQKMKTMHEQRSAAAMVASHRPVLSDVALQVRPEAGMVNQAMLRVREPCVFYDAHGVLETEAGKIFDEGEDDDDDEKPSSLPRLGNRSFPRVFSETSTLEVQEEGEEEQEEEEAESDERISGLPKLAVVNKSFSFGCRSEPSSPQFATPLTSNKIKRSRSVDSASFQDNQASSCSPEELSDEAFRKRVEEFISRMNAQLRSEAK